MSSYRRDDKAFRARMGQISSAELSRQVVGVTDYPRVPSSDTPSQTATVYGLIVLAAVVLYVVLSFWLG